MPDDMDVLEKAAKKPVTKLEKMSIQRIAFCKTPADQDGMFLLVKSEDFPSDAKLDPQPGAQPEIGLASATLDQAVLEKMVEQAVAAALQKNTPQLTAAAGDPVSNATQAADDDGGKAAIQEHMKVLVKACNESRTTPKAIKQAVSQIAKFHGVEGPDIVDDGTAERFADAITAMTTVADTLKQVVTQVASLNQAAKPAPTKKSVEDEEDDVVPLEPPAPVTAVVSEAVLKEHRETMQQAKTTLNELRKMLGKQPL